MQRLKIKQFFPETRSQKKYVHSMSILQCDGEKNLSNVPEKETKGKGRI